MNNQKKQLLFLLIVIIAAIVAMYLNTAYDLYLIDLYLIEQLKND